LDRKQISPGERVSDRDGAVALFMLTARQPARFSRVGSRSDANGADVMMKRMWRQGGRARAALALALGAVTLAPAVAEAQITRVSRSDMRNTVVFNIGYFGVKAEDARDSDDTLLIDLEGLAFDIDDFNGATFGGEWLFGVSEYIEAGVGVNYYQQTVNSLYRDVVHSNGAEIEQDLKLRMVPFTASVRFLPLGRGAGIEPYVGGGVAFINWRYTEAGEFVDFEPEPDEIFRQTYKADGWATGPVILAGLRAPVADSFILGGELRFQWAEGDTDPQNTGLLGETIDLGGWSANFSFGFRF
jgi:hypothetical protein